MDLKTYLQMWFKWIFIVTGVFVGLLVADYLVYYTWFSRVKLWW